MSGATTPSTVPDVGSQATFSIISNGVIISHSLLTGFEPRQVTNKIKSVAIDGVSRPRHLEEGWEFSLTFDRADSVLDDYFAAKEAARYSGAAVPTIQINETINEQDGSITKYRYTGIALTLTNAGRRSGNEKIEQTVDGEASRRIKVL